jgi:hypothetical protein
VELPKPVVKPGKIDKWDGEDEEEPAKVIYSLMN